ncbi:MAG: ArsR/SmtB family transcription factor [Stackebrandtia sp.]
MRPEPSGADLDLGTVLSALADPLRRKVVGELAADPSDGERDCVSFGLTVSKATRGHHFRVLREAGLIRHIDHGNHRTAQLRRADIDARFPGLLALLAAET